MRFLRYLIILLPLSLSSASAMQRTFGNCQKGGQTVITGGIVSSTYAIQSFRACTVTVYLTGTLTLATIYSDNSSTPKANPFTASSLTGDWFYYAANGRYDVTLTGGGISGTITYPDILSNDGGGGGGGGGITSLNGLTATTQTFATGTSGSDFNISSVTSTHTFNIPTASASNRGLLSSADWSTFNAKQATISVSAPINLSGTTVGLNTPLSITFGGTGQATKSLAFNALSPLTTKGDLIGFCGGTNDRSAVGTDGQVLTADSTQTCGWRWTNASISTPVSVASGGTGRTSLTAHNVILGNGTSQVGLAAPSTAGWVLTDNGGAADPSFQVLPSIGTTGSGAPSALCTAANNLYGDTTALDPWFCLPNNTWRKLLSTTNSGPGSIFLSPGTLSSLGTCNSSTEGTIGPITDSSTATWGATISGGGTNHVLAYCDSMNWTVAAK